MEKGYIQIYTGDGKGKTTAALGLALRALCAGKRVFMIQFLKGMPTSELKATEIFERFSIEQFGTGRFVTGALSEDDCKCARQGLRRLASEVSSGIWDIVIADEINCAVQLGVFSAQDVLDALQGKAESTEVVLTGRNAPKEFLSIADLVTEMHEVKHYWRKKVSGRIGIEF